jgi:hypothetical protein
LALLLVREFGTYLFDPPGGAALVELTLFTNERRGCAGEDPNVRVGRLLPDERSDHSYDTAEFRVEDKVDSFALGSADRKGDLASWLDRDTNKTRLLGGATKESFVSGVEGRMFMRRLGGRPFETSGGRSRWSCFSFPSLLRDVICPVTALMRTSMSLGKEGPC